MRKQSCSTMMLGVMLCAGTLAAQTGSTTGSGSTGTGTGSTGAGMPSQSSGATSPSSTMDSMSSMPKMNDKMFVKKAIMGNYNEIEASKLALQKSSNDQVKQYAQKMIDDHTKMLDDLHTLAQAQNIKYEDKPTPSGVKMKAKLQGLSGTAFDTAYVQGMVKDHQEDVQDFTSESNNGKMQPVKDAANKSLPIIQDHLQMAQSMQQGMKSGM